MAFRNDVVGPTLDNRQSTLDRKHSTKIILPRSIAILIPAAGRSSRLGRSKQMLRYGGRPLIEHAVEIARQAVLGPVFVVIDPSDSKVRAILQPLGVTIVENPRAAAGLGSSIKAGISAINADSALEGVIILMCDQPRVTSVDLIRLAGALADGSAVAGRYDAATVGPPAGFRRELFPRLLQIADDAGARSVLQKAGTRLDLIDCPLAAIDVDTPADAARVLDPQE